MPPKPTLHEPLEEPHRPTAGVNRHAGTGALIHNDLNDRAGSAGSLSGRSHAVAGVTVRPTEERDFDALYELSQIVYPNDEPWYPSELRRHRDNFPEGQLVAVDENDEVVGMCASLVIRWSAEYRFARYEDMTADLTFDNHDPDGDTLYGAEVMVDPRRRGLGIGKKLYAARRTLARRLGVACIRAGARLPSYRTHSKEMSAREYVDRVARGELGDPTLSFQIKQGFEVVGVIPGYMPGDRQSHGYAALIEWRNPERARLRPAA